MMTLHIHNWETLFTLTRLLKNHMVEYETPKSKHKSQRISGLARYRTGDPISLYVRKPKHSRRNNPSPLWYYKSDTRRSHLPNAYLNYAGGIVNREQIALDPRYATWRRRIACPIWCYTAGYGCFAKSISSIEICWRYKYADKIKYYASKPLLAVNGDELSVFKTK